MSALREIAALTRKPETPEKDIGKALSEAVTELGRSNSDLAAMLAKAISDALFAVESRHINVNSNQVTKWVFRMDRDKNGLLETITAEAL